MTFPDKFWQSWLQQLLWAWKHLEDEHIYLLPAVIALSLVLHHGWFFPHKTINSIVGVKIMLEFHLLFSFTLTILMVAKKKEKLCPIKHWIFKRNSNAWNFHSVWFRKAWLAVTAQCCTRQHRSYDGREATKGSLLVNFTKVCCVYISPSTFFIVAVPNS